MKPYKMIIQFEFVNKEYADKHLEELKQMAYNSIDDFDFKVVKEYTEE